MKLPQTPFNISILNLSDTNKARLGQVKSLDIFDGATKNFHPEGLYSTVIFGTVGSEMRYSRFGYIDLRVEIFHPAIFKALTQLRAIYQDIMFGKVYAIFDDQKQDFVKSNAIEGETGFHFFTQHWKKIVFEERPSELRVQNIKLIEKYKEAAMLSSVLVMPAAYRDLEISENGREESDEINGIYYKLIAISNTISPATIKVSPAAYNSQRMSLQNGFNEIYTSVSRLIDGKKNLLLGKWAARKVFNGTRNVITAMDSSSDELGARGNIGFNCTAMGIYQTAKALLPVTKHHLKIGFLSEVFPSASSYFFLTDKNTLMSTRVNLSPAVFDEWMTAEGIESKITNFKENSIRHDPIVVANDYYLGLIYRGPDMTFRLIHGLDELPDPQMRQYCTPITLAQLLYIALYPVANKYPVTVTRYPIAGNGSIYPSMIFLKSTSICEVRTPLDANWQPDESLIAYQFPTETTFFNSMSPHSSRLPGLKADFDGDTMSANALYFTESRQEVRKYFSQRKAYIGTDGKFIAATETDTLKFITHNLSAF